MRGACVRLSPSRTDNRLDATKKGILVHSLVEDFTAYGWAGFYKRHFAVQSAVEWPALARRSDDAPPGVGAARRDSDDSARLASHGRSALAQEEFACALRFARESEGARHLSLCIMGQSGSNLSVEEIEALQLQSNCMQVDTPRARRLCSHWFE